MKITRGLAAYQRAPFPVLTIGNFDGLHRGHQALLKTVVETAARVGGTPMVLTFEPHPVVVLAPTVELQLLSTREEKLARLQQSGIEEVVVLEFNRAFAALSPEEFVLGVLRDGIGVRELFVGEQFAFGKGRAGRIGDLVRLGAEAGFRVHPVAPVRVDGAPVSSTRIRLLLQQGDVRAAARCLGRPYALEGAVIAGEQRGKALGWPTANLALPAGRVVPADGVYATKAVWKARAFDSVSYIGSRPTFGAGQRLLEVYLLDQQVDLYGETIRVEFVERLRGDLAFASPEELAARIGVDVAQARESLKAAGSVAEVS
ncbi:bifunctional riboflavin kinase/FAD synthetase [Nitrospira sp. Kam-Ns4a]